MRSERQRSTGRKRDSHPWGKALISCHSPSPRITGTKPAPPIRAVGLRCQLSCRGWDSQPIFGAMDRMKATPRKEAMVAGNPVLRRRCGKEEFRLGAVVLKMVDDVGEDIAK